MKHELAFTLIGQLMEWSDARFAQEFRELQLMITHKYDSYQGFQPATRFHVALLNWLSQFKTVDERETAYRFVKERLIFLSQREMHHLVSLLAPKMDRLARKTVAAELAIPLHETWTQESAKKRLELRARRTLYVGLSDGARTDVFRRYNEGTVSNEQVVAFSEISQAKWDDLKRELVKSLSRLGMSEEAPVFEVVCLLDDFSGSGSSLLRSQEGKWKGKVAKFYDENCVRIGSHLTSNCHIHIHHHLASAQAKEQIESDLSRFAATQPAFSYTTSFSYVLPATIVIGDADRDKALVDLLKTWYDPGIQDEHTGPDIWFGYRRCGLPLVLEHNTPNNSVALLWASSKEDATVRMRPLFARRKRHSSHG